MPEEYVTDKLKERTTGRVLYPVTTADAVKMSAEGPGFDISIGRMLSDNGLRVSDYELYGYRVNLSDSNPQTRISYLEGARGKRAAYWNYTNGYFDIGDWAHAFFIKNNFPCMVKDDGTLDYRLDRDSYLLKEDGSKSDIENQDYAGSAMAAFPTIWVKRWQDKNYLYCLISDKQLDSDYHAYMHTRPDGTIAEYKYIGMYNSTLSGSRYKSLPGVTVHTGVSFENQLLYTHNIGEGWELYGLSDLMTINDLLTLISRSDDVQKTFGYGNQASNNTSNAGKIFHGGAFYNSAAVGTSSYQKMFHIHDINGCNYTRLGGLVYMNGAMLVKPYPPYNINGEGYENIGLTITGTSGGFCAVSVMNQYGRFPSVLTGGSATTYECDAVTYSNTVTAIPYTIGGYGGSTYAGKLGLNFANIATLANSYVASRLTRCSVD